MFFFVRSVLYYTNKYLKTLRLRMETTRAVGEGTAAGGGKGLEIQCVSSSTESYNLKYYICRRK